MKEIIVEEIGLKYPEYKILDEKYGNMKNSFSRYCKMKFEV